MTFAELIRQCGGIVPELIIAFTICVVVLADMLTPLSRSRMVCGLISLAGTLLALVFVLTGFGPNPQPSLTFNDMIVHDQLSRFFLVLFLLGTSVIVLFSMRSRETEDYRQGEYYSLLLGALLGAALLVESNNFIMFMISLETLSMSSYVLAGFIKHERPSAEASLKYMVYGAVTSGVLLFGISYLYGFTGTLSISQTFASLTGNPLAMLLITMLLLVGLGFKMAMVPFHFWCPDVYQGSPTPITAFLSVVSKAAGFGALLRITLPLFAQSPPATGSWPLVLLFGVLAMVTMTYGNLVAIRQTDVKRLLAYSSIAHAGYLLMGMTVFEKASIEAMLFYFFIYLFMNLGAFWVVIVLINRLGGAEIERFKGAAFKAPFLFAAMFIFLISLTGLPPTAGFVGKFMLFKIVVSAGITAMTPTGIMTPMSYFYFLIAVVGMLNSAISLYYYMMIARSMALQRPDDDAPIGQDIWDHAYAAALAIPTVALLYFTPVLDLINATGR